MNDVMNMLRSYADDIYCVPIAEAMADMTDEELARAARELGFEPPPVEEALEIMRGEGALADVVGRLARGMALMPARDIQGVIMAFISDASIHTRVLLLQGLGAQDRWWQLAFARHHLHHKRPFDAPRSARLGSLVVESAGIGRVLEGNFDGPVTIAWISKGACTWRQGTLRMEGDKVRLPDNVNAPIGTRLDVYPKDDFDAAVRAKSAQ